MQIKKIVRSYSKSINTQNYGAPESWVRCEASFEAEVETSDNPIEVSQMLHDTAKKMVIDDINAIVKNIRAAAAGQKPAAQAAAPAAPNYPANAAQVGSAPQTFTPPVTSTPAPVAGIAPAAPAQPAGTYPGTVTPPPQGPQIPGSQPLTNGAAASNPPTGSPRRL